MLAPTKRRRRFIKALALYIISRMCAYHHAQACISSPQVHIITCQRAFLPTLRSGNHAHLSFRACREIYAPNSTLPCHSERSEESSLVHTNYIGLYRFKIHSLTLRMTKWLFWAHSGRAMLAPTRGTALGRDDRGVCVWSR